jgi:hypothetical protein
MGFVTEQHESWKAKQDEDSAFADPNYLIARDNAAGEETDPGAPVDQSGAPEGYEEQSQPQQ